MYVIIHLDNSNPKAREAALKRTGSAGGIGIERNLMNELVKRLSWHISLVSSNLITIV